MSSSTAAASNATRSGTSVKVGATVDLFGTLSGEMAVGYLDRTYQDPTLPKIIGLIADGALIWQATALTSAKLTATSLVSESTVFGVSGELSRDLAIEVDHALRRWLVGTLQVGYGQDNYVGVGRVDNRYFALGRDDLQAQSRHLAQSRSAARLADSRTSAASLISRHRCCWRALCSG